MKNDVLKIILTGLAIGGLVWALSERKEKKQFQAENKLLLQKNSSLKINYFQLLQEYLKKQESISEVIKNQLMDLRKQYVGIEDAVAIELRKVVELLNANQQEYAIVAISKIIDTLLSQRIVEYHQDGFPKKAKTFYEKLKFAHEQKWITDRAFHFSMVVKEMRNSVAHELKEEKDDSKFAISLLCGIEVIYNLAGFERKE